VALLEDLERGEELTYGLGDLANMVRNRIIDLMAGKNIVAQEALRRSLRDLIVLLGGEDPTPIEMLLAERAAVCCLLLWRYEDRAVNQEGMTIAQAEYQQKLITAAHNRFNSSLKTLAQVRRLKLPSLRAQINVAVGPQQVVNERGRPRDSNSKKGIHDERSK
jgi:hypothetical protein